MFAGNGKVFWLLVLALAAGAAGAASLNRCVGPDGRVTYTDAPCPGAPAAAPPASSGAPPAAARATAPAAAPRGEPDTELIARIKLLRGRCDGGDAGACRDLKGLQAAADMRVDMRRRCAAGERLACDLYACDVEQNPAACARSRGRPEDGGFEETRRRPVGPPAMTQISITCLPSRIGRSVYENPATSRFELRRNASTPAVASFASLAEAAKHACANPAP